MATFPLCDDQVLRLVRGVALRHLANNRSAHDAWVELLQDWCGRTQGLFGHDDPTDVFVCAGQKYRKSASALPDEHRGETLEVLVPLALDLPAAVHNMCKTASNSLLSRVNSVVRARLRKQDITTDQAAGCFALPTKGQFGYRVEDTVVGTHIVPYFVDGRNLVNFANVLERALDGLTLPAVEESMAMDETALKRKVSGADVELDAVSSLASAATGAGAGAGAGARAVMSDDHNSAMTSATSVRVPKRPRTGPAPAAATFDWDHAAQQFVTDRITTFPVFTRAEAMTKAAELEAAVLSAAEWADDFVPLTRRADPKTKIQLDQRHALGGFGGVKLPSVNHSRGVISVRRAFGAACNEHLMPRIVKLLAAGAKGPDGDGTWAATAEVTGVQLFDRAMLRDEDAQVTKESGHRDKSDRDEPGTVMCGGWVALGTPDGKPQVFNCVPGDSLLQRVSGGFDKLTKAQQLALATKTFNIPLGHAVLFDETILHIVTPTAAPRGLPRPRAPQTRVFTAYALRAEPLPGEEQAAVAAMLRDGAEGTLKSGQSLPGYPNMYWGLQFDALDKAASHLQDSCIEHRTVATTGRIVRTPRHQTAMPSMVAQGIGAPSYTRDDIHLFTTGATFMTSA